jgi:hypothetical protein
MMLNGTFPLDQPLVRDQRSAYAIMTAVFGFAAFVLIFWGYPLEAMNFSDFHFYERELPVLWGLSIVDPETHRINYAFLFHNEGLMTLMYFLLNRLPLDIPDKQVFVNSFSIALQLMNVVLFTAVFWRLVGFSNLFPYLLLFLLYPFTAANHYWQACIPNNLAAAFFLASLLVHLQIDYDPDKLGRNIVLRLLPSLVLLWCSIITVELAVCFSPLYVYLALYYGNGRTAVLRFRRWVTPYTALACVFLLASILPVFLFTGHRLTVLSYASRYAELAGHVNWAAWATAGATIVGNALLTLTSFFFANTLGMVIYPLASVIQHRGVLGAFPVELYLGLLIAVVLGVSGLWMTVGQPSKQGAAGRPSPDYRFLLVLGFLWMALAYFPFALSFGYPRNVGLTADRINALGSLGAVLIGGSLIGFLRRRMPVIAFSGAMGALIALLLINIQLQKAQYVEADLKERALISAVFEENLRRNGPQPIFLLNRAEKLVPPRTQLREVLSQPSVGGRMRGVASFLLTRYFIAPPVSTSFHLNGIMMLSCCPNTTPYTFNFYADSKGVPRPLVYKYEEPFRLLDEENRYTLGYLPTGIWQEPSERGEFQSYDKRTHRMLVMEIGELTFHLGGALTYAFTPFDGAGRGATPRLSATLRKEAHGHP